MLYKRITAACKVCPNLIWNCKLYLVHNMYIIWPFFSYILFLHMNFSCTFFFSSSTLSSSLSLLLNRIHKSVCYNLHNSLRHQSIIFQLCICCLIFFSALYFGLDFNFYYLWFNFYEADSCDIIYQQTVPKF